MAAPDPLPAMIRSLLPHWNPQWLDVAVPAVKIVVILAVAGLIRLLLRQLLKRLCTRYSVPAEMMIGIRRAGGFIISVSALFDGLLSQGPQGELIPRMAEALPQGRLVTIPGAGHTPPMETPQEFTDALVSFLSQLD